MLILFNGIWKKLIGKTGNVSLVFMQPSVSDQFLLKCIHTFIMVMMFHCLLEFPPTLHQLGIPGLVLFLPFQFPRHRGRTEGGPLHLFRIVNTRLLFLFAPKIEKGQGAAVRRTTVDLFHGIHVLKLLAVAILAVWIVGDVSHEVYVTTGKVFGLHVFGGHCFRGANFREALRDRMVVRLVLLSKRILFKFVKHWKF